MGEPRSSLPRNGPRSTETKLKSLVLIPDGQRQRGSTIPKFLVITSTGSNHGETSNRALKEFAGFLHAKVPTSRRMVGSILIARPIPSTLQGYSEQRELIPKFQMMQSR